MPERSAAASGELTPKGQRTRARLLEAARTVFEREGFPATRVVDIATEARVAHGTFYTYFDSKTDIFRELVGTVMPEIYHFKRDPGRGVLTRIQRIERGNLQFYDVYRENVRLFALLEQATTFDDEVRTLRVQLRAGAEGRVRVNVEDLQARGIVDSALDAGIVASCLVAMATHSFYTWHITEQRGYDVEQANKTLTYLWASALGLTPEPEDDEFYQSIGRGRD